MAAFPCVNTQPVVECRTAQSESEWPQIREHTVSRFEQSGRGAAHGAAKHADSIRHDSFVLDVPLSCQGLREGGVKRSGVRLAVQDEQVVNVAP
eukprot:5885036-Pleurochrysis_carterae.AAC.1